MPSLTRLISIIHNFKYLAPNYLSLLVIIRRALYCYFPISCTRGNSKHIQFDIIYVTVTLILMFFLLLLFCLAGVKQQTTTLFIYSVLYNIYMQGNEGLFTLVSIRIYSTEYIFMFECRLTYQFSLDLQIFVAAL